MVSVPSIVKKEEGKWTADGNKGNVMSVAQSLQTRLSMLGITLKEGKGSMLRRFLRDVTHTLSGSLIGNVASVLLPSRRQWK